MGSTLLTTPEELLLRVDILTREDLICWADGYGDLGLTLRLKQTSDIGIKPASIRVDRYRVDLLSVRERTPQRIALDVNKMFGASLWVEADANPKDYEAFRFLLGKMEPYTGYPYS